MTSNTRRPSRIDSRARYGSELTEWVSQIRGLDRSAILKVGADFELVALEFFANQDVKLTRNFAVELGVSDKKKHCFDLGSANPKIIVECKSHKWTAGANVPSAKMTVWNEAMYYFHLAPKTYRKILFVLHDRRDKDGEKFVELLQEDLFSHDS